MYNVHNPVKNGTILSTTTAMLTGEDTMSWFPLADLQVLGAPALVRSAFTDPMEELRIPGTGGFGGFEAEGGP